jgi:transcriptional regulator with XRE-family HTH domain
LNINERILHLIENQYNNNQKKFAESIGYSAQVIFNIVSGRKSSPSYDVLNAIVSTNDDINSEWLLTGQGSMLKSGITPIIVEKQEHTSKLAILEQDNARLQETNELLRFKVATLEERLIELRHTRSETFLQAIVAEPAPELTGKKHK